MNEKKAQFLPANGLDDDETEVFSTIIDETVEQLTAADIAANAAIEQLNSVAENAKSVKIMRQTGRGNESMQFVMSEPADKYSIDQLILIVQKNYGSGDYRFMIYNERGKLAANKLISIAEKISPENNGYNSDGMSAVFSQYMNKTDLMLRQLLGDKKSEGNDRTEFLKEMVLYKELFSGGKTPQQNPMDQIKEVLTVMEMLKTNINPEPEQKESGGFGELISQSMPLLTALAQGATLNRGHAAPQNNDAKQRRQPKRKSNNESDKMLNVIADNLLTEINAGTDTDIVAQKLTEQVPSIYEKKFIAFLIDPEIVKKLVNVNDKLKSHEKWLIDVVEWSKWIMNIPSKFSKFDGNELTKEKEGTNIDVDSDILENDESKINGDSSR